MKVKSEQGSHLKNHGNIIRCQEVELCLSLQIRSASADSELSEVAAGEMRDDRL